MGHPPSTVLVIDDNAENRALARAVLEDEDYRVLLAESGQAGIDLFATGRPDCVLLDVSMPGKDGFDVCSEIRAMPGAEETPILFLTAMRDVDTFDRAQGLGGTDFLVKPIRPAELAARVQTALALRRMSVELREHYELVRHQRDDLMRLQLQKERLVAFVVHDLKSPVAAMDLHAQFALRDNSLSESARDSLEHIRSDAQGLLRMILNLLDISKADEGRLVPRLAPVDLDALSLEVIDCVGARARAADVTLVREIGAPAVNADRDLLLRVLENLVENAIRHAPKGSDVRLSTASMPGSVEIRIADRGKGVLPALRDKIFDPFVQVESGDLAVTRSGRGLGLAFCKQAIEAHGGGIWVEDGEPGAVVRVSLPND